MRQSLVIISLLALFCFSPIVIAQPSDESIQRITSPQCIAPGHVLAGYQSYSYTGRAVAGIGHVNDDNFPDVMVGSPTHQVVYDEGWVFTYYGISGGIDTVPDLIYQNQAQDAHYGCSVAGAVDVNADGFDDVIIGAFNYPNPGGQSGAIFVHLGSTLGLDSNWVFMDTGSNPTGRMGYSVSGAGDVNGDGFDDVIVGDPEANIPVFRTGAVHLYYGASYGIDTTASGHVIFRGTQTNQAFGFSVTGAGDVNGDGYDDIAIGAEGYSNGQQQEGAVFVYHGSSTGVDTIPDLVIESNQANANMGNQVSEARDVNSDGYGDLIVGAWTYDNGQNNEGAAWVHHGSSTGLDPTPAVLLEVNQASAFFSYSMDAVGDLNGDGYDDIAVGTPYFDDPQSTEGIVSLYLGSPTGISSTPIYSLTEHKINSWFGESISWTGDLNQDGYDDILVGAMIWYDTLPGPPVGAGLIYYGSPCGVSAPPVQQQFAICPGDSVVVGSTVYTSPGFYQDTLVGCNGCDSLISTFITLLAAQITWTFPNDTLCLQAMPIGLSASPGGGSFTGNGVTGTQFDPMAAGIGTHWISYQYLDSASSCLVTDSIAQVVDICSRIDAARASALRIWPNPGRDRVRVAGLLDGSVLEVCDGLGRVLLRRRVVGTEVVLDLGGLESGVYAVRCIGADGWRVGRVLRLE